MPEMGEIRVGGRQTCGGGVKRSNWADAEQKFSRGTRAGVVMNF